MADSMNVPRIVLAALKGGAGKTFLTVGLAKALRRRGLSIGVFKKGPDYIDAGWLALAASCNCYNLDAYLFNRGIVQNSFLIRSLGHEMALIEGNRGLFDGVDSIGSFSTAELAKLIRAPVILVIDATKMTRTAAALVLGCTMLDPELAIKGVILNRVAGVRHEKVLRESIENTCSVPVLGSINKLAPENFPQRHLGLVPMFEHPSALGFVDEAADVVEHCIDLDRVLEIGSSARPFCIGNKMSNHDIRGAKVSVLMTHSLSLADPPDPPLPKWRKGAPQSKSDNNPGTGYRRTLEHSGLRIGVVRDSAFQFYYPENLEELSCSGAELVEVSALEAKELPLIDALYIGGGFPETHASLLAENSTFKESLRHGVQAGLPVYAECGGLMYLSRTLCIDDREYSMVGVFPVDTVLERKPQGHGYIQVEVLGANPFFPIGTTLRGHEFHYSYVTQIPGQDARYAYKILRGYGMNGVQDGICRYNALGTYVHLHALGTPLWAKGILTSAEEFSNRLKNG